MTETIEIDITITMGDTCSNTMSLAEARMLFDTLGGLFNGGHVMHQEPVHTSIPEGKIKRSTPKQKQNTIEENMKRLAEAEEKLRVAEEKLKIQATTPNPVVNDETAPNPKVEAARERAAKRTRGCGSR